MSSDGTEFCREASLGYEAARRRFGADDALTFDHSYRLTHLPLVAPGHPLAIRAVPGQDYDNGKYKVPRYSVVVPVDATTLAISPVFRAIDDALRAGSFSAKIAWDICERRASKLHASVINDLATSDADACAASIASVLPALGSLSMRIGGPFIGDRNTGRLYFPVYPQIAAGRDSFSIMQEAVGARLTRFYAVGYYHLRDELDRRETADLARLLERWRYAQVAELPLSTVVVHATNDNLALSGRTYISIDARSGKQTRHAAQTRSAAD
ncbi:MAG TPA: hypothetical protein VHM01_10530 [Alphaproteobacteria bacterium]|nr:hypothetical protein [Alphaproteobacteria bacterium]